MQSNNINNEYKPSKGVLTLHKMNEKIKDLSEDELSSRFKVLSDLLSKDGGWEQMMFDINQTLRSEGVLEEDELEYEFIKSHPQLFPKNVFIKAK